VSALSTPNGGGGYNSSTDSIPNTISSIQLQCIQAASPHLADKTTSNPNRNVVCINLLHINLHTLPILYMIQKEWHWPPNIYKNYNLLESVLTSSCRSTLGSSVLLPDLRALCSSLSHTCRSKEEVPATTSRRYGQVVQIGYNWDKEFGYIKTNLAT
jgi:hypothetical protein